MLFRSQTCWCLGYRPSDAQGSRSCFESWWGSADEHVFETLSRAARLVPVGLRSDDSLRSHFDWQMVLRELQRKEFLEPFDARSARDHQPLQADPPSQKQHSTRRTLSRGH